MNLQSYVVALRAQWQLFVGTLALSITAALVLFLILPVSFTATVSMYVSAQVGDSAQAAYQGAQLSQQRVKSYTEIATSPRVLEPVIAQLKLPLTVERLASKVKATSSLDSVVIDISATDQDARRAADIANSAASSFGALVEELERPTSPDGIPPVSVRTIQNAAIPASPSSVSWLDSLAIGAGAGLLLGLVVALGYNRFSNRVLSTIDVLDAVGAPSLVEVPASKRAASHSPLVMTESPRGPRAEAYRELRNNLRYVQIDKKRQVIMITSPSPSDGKTTTILNLAHVLGEAGLRSIVLDCDLRRPRIASSLGLDSAIGLTQVLTGELSSGQVTEHWGGGIFDVICSGPLPPNPSELVGSGRMAELLNSFRHSYDYILVDTPPVRSVSDAAGLASQVDGVVLVSRYNGTRKNDLQKTAQTMRSADCLILGTVLTNAPSARGGRSYHYYEDDGRSRSPEGSSAESSGSKNARAKGDSSQTVRIRKHSA